MKKMSLILNLAIAGMVVHSGAGQYVSDLNYDDDVERGVYFGSGNENGAFTINRNVDLGIELGLRGKLRYESTYNSLGDGRYVYPAGGYPGDENLALWNFEFSIDTDFMDEVENTSSLADYYFELTIDKDPTAAVEPINVSLLIAGAEKNFVNDVHTENLLWWSWEVDEYAGAQDSQNFGFEHFNWDLLGDFDLEFDPMIEGSYEISLGAYLWDSLRLCGDKSPLAFTSIEILVTREGMIQSVPEPATIGLISVFGLVGLLSLRNYRRKIRK